MALARRSSSVAALLLLCTSFLVAAVQAQAQETPAAVCTEHPRVSFINSRGISRNCDWIGRQSFRIEQECSLGMPYDTIETEADKICPVTCGKCPPGSKQIIQGNYGEGQQIEKEQGEEDTVATDPEGADTETTTTVEEKVIDILQDDQTDTDENNDSNLASTPTDFASNLDPATTNATADDEDTIDTSTQTKPSGIKFTSLLDQQAESEAAAAAAHKEATTHKPRPARPSILPKSNLRKWTDVTFHVIPDPMQIIQSPPSLERDPFFFTDHPSMAPSESPTDQPSALPSASPSAAPTQEYPMNPMPSNPPSKYFDYRPGKNAKRGPEKWDNVDDPPEGRYWKEEYGEYIEPSLGKNRCDSKSRRQSPIDLRFEDSKGQCFEYHGIRPKPGMYDINDPKVTTKIMPSKLRIQYPPNFGSDWGGASENDQVKGPSADIPKGWGHQLPVTHVDIKIPSEHWMEGKQYVAEYQINLIQNRDSQRGAPVISVLFDLHPEDKPNFRIQQLLDHFQLQYDTDLAECKAKQRKERKLDAARLVGLLRGQGDHKSTWLDEPAEEEAKFQEYRRKLQEEPKYRKFNVWDEEWIVVSTWFFGYEGSLTEPPCTEFLEWRIIDKPALISKDQLEQMKTILFKHTDKNCEKTSVHYEGSVARPLQPYSGRLIHRCMCRDFLSDDERKEYGNNRCAWVDREKFGFPRDVFTLEWYEKTHKYEDPSDQPMTDWASF